MIIIVIVIISLIKQTGVKDLNRTNHSKIKTKQFSSSLQSNAATCRPGVATLCVETSEFHTSLAANCCLNDDVSHLKVDGSV